MRIEDSALPGVRVIHLEPHADARGLFVESYDTRSFATLGVDTAFVLDAFSNSARRGTVRGLHFQVPPRGQDRLVRVVEVPRITSVGLDWLKVIIEFIFV